MLDMYNLISKVGELSELTTTENPSIVSAINEIKSEIDQWKQNISGSSN